MAGSGTRASPKTARRARPPQSAPRHILRMVPDANLGQSTAVFVRLLGQFSMLAAISSSEKPLLTRSGRGAILSPPAKLPAVLVRRPLT